jgi:hypothetical protein
MRSRLSFKVLSSVFVLPAAYQDFVRADSPANKDDPAIAKCNAGSFLQVGSVRDIGSHWKGEDVEHQARGAEAGKLDLHMPTEIDAASQPYIVHGALDFRHLVDMEERHVQQIRRLLRFGQHHKGSSRKRFDELASEALATAGAEAESVKRFSDASDEYLREAMAAAAEVDAATLTRAAFKQYLPELAAAAAKVRDARDMLTVVAEDGRKEFGKGAQTRLVKASTHEGATTAIPVSGVNSVIPSWLQMDMAMVTEKTASSMSSLNQIVQAPVFLVAAAIFFAASGIALLSLGRVAHCEDFDDACIFESSAGESDGQSSPCKGFASPSKR